MPSVDGATVRLFDRFGKELKSATTDKDGLARFPGVDDLLPPEPTEERRWSTPFMLVSAEKNGDVGVTSSFWDEGLGPSAAGVSMDWDGEIPFPRPVACQLSLTAPKVPFRRGRYAPDRRDCQRHNS